MPIGALSGGQFQRLLVAFALLGDPTVLLLDEPAAGVDAPGQVQLYESVRQLQKDSGPTVVFISHDLSVVYRYAAGVAILSTVLGLYAGFLLQRKTGPLIITCAGGLFFLSLLKRPLR